MKKNPKTLNPVDRARKEARKKELKKNKKQRQQVREAVKAQREIEAVNKAQEVRIEDVILPPEPKIPKPAPSKSVGPSRQPHQPQPQQPVHLPPDPAQETVKSSVIEAKPVIFKPAVTRFVPASVRSKLTNEKKH